MKKIKVGAAFSDFVYQESPHIRTHKTQNTNDEVTMRPFLFPVIILLGFLLLAGRLFYLQIIQGQKYRLLSDINRTRREVIHAPRGIIFDRNGLPLVYNSPGFRETVNGKTVLISQKDGLQLLVKQDPKLEIDSLRSYPYKDDFAHVVGYIGQISKEELKLPRFNNYLANDVVGKEGLEQQYEGLLRGTDGQKLVEVDASGRHIRTLGQTEPTAGENITTTLDAVLQQKTFEAMKDVKKGAAIVSTPTGEILAVVSKPSFDPNLFTLGSHYEATQSSYPSVDAVLADNQNQPLLNRAIGGTYPPGSTFKLITAAAGLEEGKIDKSYTIEDTGILQIGSFSFSNWYYSQYGKTEGTVDVVKAIKRSNDIFFYKLGNLVGVDGISDEAKKFGLGGKLNVDLAGEQPGLVPTREWKKQTLGEDWFLGDNYHYGIGQGYVLVTPLQVNGWTQAIANGGTLYMPHLLIDNSVKVLSTHLLSSENFSLIKEGMIGACSTGGVAWPLFDFKIKIACKTGTAQHGDENTMPHAWITLFAPVESPKIVVTVLAESSGEGSNVAAPIAKKILEAYFNK